MNKLCLLFLLLNLSYVGAQEKPELIKVKPQEIDEVLTNPGIGFTTFQRFNGDALNPRETNNGAGWTEGLPIAYQTFNGDLSNKKYPQTSIAYFRLDWSFLEPEYKKYDWSLIDKALDTAAERGQSLMLRIAPYEDADRDVPLWYRKMVGAEKKERSAAWRIDPEDPRYVHYFGGMIRALGQRYDGHPNLLSVDVSLIGFWGEGDGSHLLSEPTRRALINSYLNHFKKTQLIFQPLNGDAPDPGMLVKGTPVAAYWPDGRNNGSGPPMRHLGYRMDCLGDMTTELWPAQKLSHMLDIYPREIIRSGMSDAWKKAPVATEICWTFKHWLEKLKYDEKTVEYIFSQALKWHVSSFNAKSSEVPEVWRPLVDKWLNKMGYRFVLRTFEYPSFVKPDGKLNVSFLLENIGVAPIYTNEKLAVRLKNANRTLLILTDANLRNWLPGDIVHDDSLSLPRDLPAGVYHLEIAIVSPLSHEPSVKLAIGGRQKNGWYSMGEIQVKKP